ncbi:hypothetical protein ANAPC5_01305 [Anaplasma phagocytophilum]|nr:hypothetical protein ANAPC5_01305 [Anaplasma phagocytophilum]
MVPVYRRARRTALNPHRALFRSSPAIAWPHSMRPGVDCPFLKPHGRGPQQHHPVSFLGNVSSVFVKSSFFVSPEPT